MRPLIQSRFILTAFVLGVSATLLLPAIPDLLIMLALISALAGLSILIPNLRCILVMAVAFAWACWVANFVLESHLPPHWQSKSVLAQGYVSGLPTGRDDQIRFRFYVQQWLDAETLQVLPQISAGLVQLSCYRCDLDIRVDQQWRFSVRVKRPHGYASWGAFDYEKYLFRHRVIAKGYVRQKEANQMLAEQRSINGIRQRLRDHLNQLIADESVGKGMLLALMIGDKSALSAQNKEVFQHVGLSHLMAISGLHIGLIFVFIKLLSRYLLWPFARLFNLMPRQYWVLFPSLLAAVGYASLAGFAVSSQRALIMLSVYVVCRLLSRQVALIDVLLIAAVIVLLLDPLSVLDVGFWLSFTAVAIIALANRRQQVVKLWQLQPLLWLGMMPVSVLFFSQLSLLSPLINLMAVPLFCLLLIPLTLIALLCILGQFTMLGDGLLGLLHRAFNFVYDFLLWIENNAVTHSEISEISALQWAIYAAIIFAYVKSYRYRHYLWLIFLVALLFTNKANKDIENGEFNVVLLDVGQGLSMVVSTNSYNLVYDAGPRYSSGFSAAQAVVIPYLKNQRIRVLDRVIISHADNDHIGGFNDLLKEFDVSSVLTSRPDKFNNAQMCQTGQHWLVDGVQFKILSPELNTPMGSNNWSCVLRVSNQRYSVLITGDIERPVEQYLVEHNLDDLAADILLVPHQGSKTSSSDLFINSVNPRAALLAAGYRNHYGHPHREVIQRYKKRQITVYSTIKEGSILLNVNNNNYNFSAYRQDQKRFWMM